MFKTIHSKVLSVACASILLAACGSAPVKNSQLESAKAAYERAQASPDIAGSPAAQTYLFQANEALTKAKAAESSEQIEHYAYIAEQKINTALEMAKRKAAEKRVEDLAKEKDKAVLDSREREIAKAKAEAEARAREAEMRAREAEMALEKARDLEKQLADLQAKQTDRGMVLTLGDVLFETGKANLLPGAMSTITKLAMFLKENPDKTLLIEGHTDSRGSDDYNMELSRNRAYSVRNALLDLGVDSKRMTTAGYGESKPIADNNSESGRQQNRRVEIVIQ
jgi:outer membrane protein OmpA-like peptidoglycan-associated protein